jgi:hypothetical protein
MHNGVEAVPGEQLAQGGFIEEITDYQFPPFYRFAMAGGEIVKGCYTMPCFGQHFDHVGADVPCPAAYQDVHALSLHKN